LTLHQILSGLVLKSIYYKEEMAGKKIIDISSAKTVLRYPSVQVHLLT
jgi:hypothetical protein